MLYEDVYREMAEELVVMVGAEKLASTFYVAAKRKSFEMRSSETPAALMKYVCERLIKTHLEFLVDHMSKKRGGRFYFVGLDGADLAQVLSKNFDAVWPHVNVMLHCDMYEMFPEELFKTKLENILLMQSPRATFNQFLNWYDEMKDVNSAAAEKQVSFTLSVRSMLRLASLLPDWADQPQIWTDDGRDLSESLAALKARVSAGLVAKGLLA